ncbi:MAG TPA: helical backbone metal receptor [Candidatus Eremiobacteraceae bacterium]|jgi:iron complex transport system substrate-binding protein|nr:helical backbone metal receptor [Candidatus Eremiobacteraceae bacterium]
MIALVATLGALAACAHGRVNSTATEMPTSNGPRLISLAPSLTEIAFAIGCGGSLVADTTFDDYPPAAKSLPHVADLAHADLERIARLRPNIVVAVHDQEHEGGSIQARLGIPVTYLPNRNLDDLYADIAGVAQACERAPQGEALTAQIKQRLKRVEARPLTTAHRPRVLFLLGLPGFTAGKSSFINDLIVLAGGENIAGQVDQPYPDLSAEAILQADPDIIIVSKDTPFGPDVRAREPWRSLRAVQRGRVVRPPDDSIVERNGPRVVDGLEWLSVQFR